jgi:hypothetical protein
MSAKSYLRPDDRRDRGSTERKTWSKVAIREPRKSVPGVCSLTAPYRGVAVDDKRA